MPNQNLSNEDISRIVNTSDDWIKTRTGISNRRIASFDENVSHMGYQASLKALEMADWPVESIDLIILATSTPDDLFGSAPVIQSKLKAKNAVAFDITAACSGFIFALITASQYIQSGSYKRAIVIGSDQLSSYVNWKDRGSCILFGDGAGAIAIEANQDCNNFYGFQMKTDGERGNFLNLLNQNKEGSIIDNVNFRQGNFSKISMNGQEVYKFAVREVPLIIKKLIQIAEISSSEIDWPQSYNQN